MTRLRQMRYVLQILFSTIILRQILISLSFKQDVAWLIPRLGNLKAAIRVDSPTFSHGDFIWSPRLAELVHLPVIDLLPSPFAYKKSVQMK